MVNLEILSLLIFFGLIGLYLLKNKKKITYNGGLIIIRWKRGKEILDVIANKFRKILPAVGILSILVGLFATFLGLYLIIQLSLRFEQAFGIALPSVSGVSYPAPIVGVPFWYWIIGIFTIVFVHESMHGIFARLDNVRIKSYGLMTFFVLPIGAFVDPDNKQIEKLSMLKKLRIFSAGSFINIVLGLLFLLLAVWLFSNLYEDKGVNFSETMKDLPAYNTGLNGTIHAINGQEIKTIQDLSEILNGIDPGTTIQITTSQGVYTIETASRPDGQPGSFIGIGSASTHVDIKDALAMYKFPLNWFYGLLLWLHILNFGVGIANMLPIKPLDGGLFYEEILKKYFGSRSKKIMKYISIAVALLFLFNIFGIPILKYFQ
ncbi:MAG: site-2 protease family protein [Candidatus Aenigmarchaeota archaeon]|nr:site-2 protease family protein [Candidatus Aenigmarchaeota archaeon]